MDEQIVGILARLPVSGRRVLLRAQRIAHENGSQLVDVSHLAVALVEEPNSVAFRMIERLGQDCAATSQKVRVDLSFQPRSVESNLTDDQIAFTPAAQDLLNAAGGAADLYGDAAIGTEALLLALLQVSDDSISGIFDSDRVTPDRVHEQVRLLLDSDSIR